MKLIGKKPRRYSNRPREQSSSYKVPKVRHVHAVVVSDLVLLNQERSPIVAKHAAYLECYRPAALAPRRSRGAEGLVDIKGESVGLSANCAFPEPLS